MPTRRSVRRLAIACVVVASAALPAARAAGPAADRCDWPMYGHDPRHSFAAADGCTTLDPSTALTLLPDWTFLTPDSVSASPTVVDGTVYVGDWGGTFYALPARAGLGPVTPRWTFTVRDRNDVAFGRIVSSAAVTDVAGRRIVLFGGGATLYALDAASGRELASLCLDPRADPAVRCRGAGVSAEIESSPVVVTVGGETRVLVGLDVHNADDVGRTGLVSVALVGGPSLRLEPRWKFDPEGPTTYRGADQLTAGSGTGAGCASVWASPAVDVAAGLAFVGTGSCSHDGVTAGESLWATDLATGELRWVFHPPRPSTRLDDDFGASPNLLPGGLVGNGGKDGWYYALVEQPVSGGGAALAWATHVGESGHLTEDFAIGGIIGTPAVGTVQGEPAIFITTAISTPIASPVDTDPSLDVTLLTDPARLLSLSALRASDGAVLWRSVLPRQSYGAPTFANGVVLVPSTFSFQLLAIDASNGSPMAALPLIGAPSSAPTVVGDQVFIGTGTRTTDLEFKALGEGVLDGLFGPSPLSPLSSVSAFRVADLRQAAG
jgi:polyvinyl alcohol dehydrogenase (cytochrome)